MTGALVGAFAVIVQTLPPNPEAILTREGMQTAMKQAKMSEEARVRVSRSASSAGNHLGLEDCQVNAKKTAWRAQTARVRKFDFDFDYYKNRARHIGLHSGAVQFLQSNNPIRTSDYDYKLQEGYMFFDVYGLSPWKEQGPNKMALPWSMTQVIAEIHLTFQCFIKQGVRIPENLKWPRDKSLRSTAAHDGYVDYGNMVWEAMFWSGRFYKFFGHSVEHFVHMCACPNDQYGTATNKSSHGPVNMRGNILESLLNFLYEGMQEERSWSSSTPTWYTLS